MATLSSNACLIQPTFLHSSLVASASCPFCQQVYAPSEQAPGLSVTQSQYTPITTAPVQSFRQTIGSASSFRTLKPSFSNISGANSALGSTMFAVRVAYARYLPQKDPFIPAQINWTVFNDTQWPAEISNSTPLTYWTFKQRLVKAGDAQCVGYITRLIYPVEPGKFIVSTNHLDSKHPTPSIWGKWSDEILIQDALTKTDYAPAGKKGNPAPYPVTLLWYPDQETEQPLLRERARSVHTIATESILSEPVDDLYLIGLQATARGRQAALEAPPEAVGPSETTPASGHKRQISEAIPSNERANEAQQEGTQEAGGRRSARARKPKVRA